MKRALVWLGGLALLSATAIDTASVIGRNLGAPLHASIELMQPAILVAGVLALFVATFARGHASVHILTDRMSERMKAATRRIAAFATALLFAALLAGAVSLMADLWNAHEVSELVGVPWRWMRLFANLGLAVILGVLLRQAFAPARREGGQ